MTVTDADRAMLVRPQPLGIFEGTAGLLLVRPGAEEVLAGLAAGSLPGAWPEAAAVIERVLADDIDGARALVGDAPEDIVNRFVLTPTPEHHDAARAAAGTDLRLAAVVDAAAYASGLSDVPPAVDGLDGEFAVLALTVRAARALEFKDRYGAERALRDAATVAAGVGPALHGRVLGMVAEHLERGHGATLEVLAAYDEALAQVGTSDLVDLRCGLHLQRALVAHQLSDQHRHLLLEAIRSYQSALIGLDEHRDPEPFALANMNVAIAILSLPMTQTSDQVRLGVAVQSLRAALRVYSPDTHAYEWSRSQMNLANALQYLPSTHREQNLREAVDLYEAVLAVRSARSDPAGFARVLANQANALAHLGAFDDAEAKYRAAREHFAAAADADAVEVVDRQLQQIADERGSAR